MDKSQYEDGDHKLLILCGKKLTWLCDKSEFSNRQIICYTSLCGTKTSLRINPETKYERTWAN